MDENVRSNHDQDDGAFAYSSYSIMCNDSVPERQEFLTGRKRGTRCPDKTPPSTY